MRALSKFNGDTELNAMPIQYPLQSKALDGQRSGVANAGGIDSSRNLRVVRAHVGAGCFRSERSLGLPGAAATLFKFYISSDVLVVVQPTGSFGLRIVGSQVIQTQYPCFLGNSNVFSIERIPSAWCNPRLVTCKALL